MLDLTFDSFAYLRLPLLVAGVAFLGGAIATVKWVGERAFLATALMMVLFFHAARLALVVFDPYMSSRPLADAVLRSPDGKLITDHNYWIFSSLTFYVNREALSLNGRYNNLEYGSYAPGAPNVFINDSRLKALWQQPERYYLEAYQSSSQRFEDLLGKEKLNLVAAAGGKMILTNHPLQQSQQKAPTSPLSASNKNQLAKAP